MYINDLNPMTLVLKKRWFPTLGDETCSFEQGDLCHAQEKRREGRTMRGNIATYLEKLMGRYFVGISLVKAIPATYEKLVSLAGANNKTPPDAYRWMYNNKFGTSPAVHVLN